MHYLCIRFWFRSSVGLEQQPSKLWVPGSSPGGITQFLFFLLGFIGNQPFLTRSRCSNISNTLHSDEHPVMPITEASNTSDTNSEMPSSIAPTRANTGQHFTPQ